MKVLLKLFASVLVAIGAFLIYAVIHAVLSAGGARVGVAAGYVAGAIVLGFVAAALWRKSAPSAKAPTPAGQ